MLAEAAFVTHPLPTPEHLTPCGALLTNPRELEQPAG